MQPGGTLWLSQLTWLSHFNLFLVCQQKATGKMNRPRVTSLSSKLLAGQLDSTSCYTGICGCPVGIVLVMLGHAKTLTDPSEELCHENILSPLFCGFAVNCLCLLFLSMLEAICGNSQASGNGIKASPELSLLICSTLQQASGVKQACVTERATFGSQGYSKP